MFYTYLWLREDGTPYYVGKGSGHRAFVSWGHRHPRPKDRSSILIQEFPSERDAFSAEIFLISYYGRKDLGTGCLRNLSGGYNHRRVRAQLERKTMVHVLGFIAVVTLGLVGLKALIQIATRR